MQFQRRGFAFHVKYLDTINFHHLSSSFLRKTEKGRTFVVEKNSIAMEYLSKECYDKLVAELNEMINVELPAVKDEIAEARDKGDLSENFEYHAAKRKQGKLLGRIRFKQRVLQYARVMDTTNLNAETVGLFRRIEITNVAMGKTMAYSIVNPHESNLSEGKLSIKSPIAQALLGHKAGDTVQVQVPSGMLTLRIESIALMDF